MTCTSAEQATPSYLPLTRVGTRVPIGEPIVVVRPTLPRPVRPRSVEESRPLPAGARVVHKPQVRLQATTTAAAAAALILLAASSSTAAASGRVDAELVPGEPHDRLADARAEGGVTGKAQVPSIGSSAEI